MKHFILWIIAVEISFANSAQVTRHESTSDEKSSCDVTEFVLRGEEGFPIQMEKKSKSDYEATMCEGVSGFRTTVRLNEPVFSTGITCSISGVPGGLEKVEHGSTKVVEFSVVKKPAPESKALTTLNGLTMFSSATGEKSISLTSVPLTFTAFVKVPVNFGRGRVGIMMGSYPNANNINWEVHADGKPRLWWKNGKVDWKVNVDVRTDTWKHVAFVVNQAGTQAQCFIDGLLVASKSGTFDSVMPNGETLVGNDHRAGGSQKFKAELKCVKLFGESLSASEVATLADDCQAETTTKYKLSVKRLSVAADQEACKVTMTRSAIQDCGYAPMLEKKRQEAAMIKGMKPPPTPPPQKISFLQRVQTKSN